MTPNTSNPSTRPTPNCGVDGPSVMRNFFVFGTLALLLVIFLPHRIHLGPVAISSRTFAWTAGFLLALPKAYLMENSKEDRTRDAVECIQFSCPLKRRPILSSSNYSHC
jgi:hypothetical protein